MPSPGLLPTPVLQVLCTVTLGPPDDAQKLDSLVGPSQKRFMVHYSFPPFSVNEVRPARGGLNRREVGHGMSAPYCALLHPFSKPAGYRARAKQSTLLGSSSVPGWRVLCFGLLLSISHRRACLLPWLSCSRLVLFLLWVHASLHGPIKE